ncbi:hypothetical protein DY023_17450 [Microbacterium bovistercoris]|uniref:Uncharacterized protein n=1 Tax=Microbacterium bovistercoris TaxID=2293570 RepID=A0A371NPG6_9MICO|nr:hypothetical protein [Microbacterium bovistercoris]REJ04091.1 hypothetical protein DY023_17450 [Microbacterium bovistercoris]
MSGDGDAPLTRAQLRAQRAAAEEAARAAETDAAKSDAAASAPQSAPVAAEPDPPADPRSPGITGASATGPSVAGGSVPGVPGTVAPVPGLPAAGISEAGAPGAGASAPGVPATGAPGVPASDAPGVPAPGAPAPGPTGRQPIRPEIMGPEPEDERTARIAAEQAPSEPERAPRTPAILRRRDTGGEPIRPELMGQEDESLLQAAPASDPQRAAVYAAAAAAAAAAAEADAAPGRRHPAPGPRRSSAAQDAAPAVPTPTTPVSRLEPIPWEPAAAPESDGSAYRRRRLLYIVLAAVAAVLLIAGGVFAFVFSQSLRVLGVDVDPERAVEAPGTTLTFDTNHDLAAVDASQVSVEPAVPFTVEVDGSSLGIRFTEALDDTTEFTVTVEDAAAQGGSPTADLTTIFTTPKSQIFLLQRSDEKDKIFTSDLSGENGVPVFSSSRIVDFRATPDNLVVVVEEDGGSRLVVMDRKGDRQRDLKLPGDGFITSLQVSDRGGLVGYTYSDADVTETSGRASVLVTQPLDGSSGPAVVQVGGEDVGVSDWEFVPDSSKVLFVDFANALTLDDRAGDAPAQDFGLVAELLGTTRDTAIIERTEGTFIELSLKDGTETPLPATDPDYGTPSEIVPFPDGTLQHVVQRNDSGAPTGQAVIQVDPDGAATPVFEVGDDSSIIQMCASPSGQYAAVTVAPDVANNPYDELLLPLPTTLHTTLLDLRTGDQLVTLSGFDVSWCGSAPQP